MSDLIFRIPHCVVAVVHSVCEIAPESTMHPFPTHNSNIFQKNESDCALAGRRRDVGVACLQFRPDGCCVYATFFPLLIER